MNDPRPAAWSIRLTYDAEHDYVHAAFANVVLHDEADAERWRAEISSRLATFGRPVDLIIDLTGLVVRPRAASAFGRLRSEVLQRYSVHSYRYGGDGDTRTSIFTSSVLHHAEANLHASRAAAVAALLATRQAERPAEPRPPSQPRAAEPRPPSQSRAAEPRSASHLRATGPRASQPDAGAPRPSQLDATGPRPSQPDAARPSSLDATDPRSSQPDAADPRSSLHTRAARKP